MHVALTSDACMLMRQDGGLPFRQLTINLQRDVALLPCCPSSHIDAVSHSAPALAHHHPAHTNLHVHTHTHEPANMHAPGTGKTTIARRMGLLFQSLGLLGSSEVVSCSASDFVTGYVNQSSGKTRQVFTKALGGVLFIDEAYRRVAPVYW